jgi:hypothetical protein
MSLMSLRNTPQIALPNRPNSVRAAHAIAGRVSAKCNRGTRSTADRHTRVGRPWKWAVERGDHGLSVPSPAVRPCGGARPLPDYMKVWKKMRSIPPTTDRRVQRVAMPPVAVARGRTEGAA